MDPKQHLAGLLWACLRLPESASARSDVLTVDSFPRVQALDAWAVQVARDSRLPVGYRYVGQRLAELLDVRARLAVSASVLPPPAVRLREAQDVLAAHRGNSQNPTANLASAH